jgi:hypothetical protein
MVMVIQVLPMEMLDNKMLAVEVLLMSNKNVQVIHTTQTALLYDHSWLRQEPLC